MKDHGHTELEELQGLLALVTEHDLDALLVEDGEWRVELVRRDYAATPAVVAVAPAAAEAPVASSTVAPTPVAAQDVPAGEVVAAPIVGVFYRAPAPNAPAFVQVGDRVAVGQTLCILEAMKLMNEITAEVAGVITSIHAENGELVTIGSPLFRIAR